MLVYDLETDGFLEDVTVVHCINVIDRTTGKRLAFNGGVYADGTPAQRDGTVEEGVRFLEEHERVGHNVINYDEPVLKKLHDFKPKVAPLDTRVFAQVLWPDVKEWDFDAIAKGSLHHDFQKKGLVGKHGLEAWGYRLGDYKGDFSPGDYPNPGTGEKHTWKTIGFTKEMDTYGRQDVEVTLTLLEKIESKQLAQECADLEHRVATIVFAQTLYGFAFDMKAAEALVATLQRRHAEIESQLQPLFPPWYSPDVKKGTAVWTPKKDNKANHYTGGAPLSRVKEVVFNPGSRDNIADRLMKLRGWKPATFTDNGKPQVDETTLGALPWPEAKLLTEYLTIEKRLGQIAEGREAWIKNARKKPDGTYRVHGSVTTNGAITGRMSHARPNVAQTPRVGSPYGEECRACWTASPGLVLVGCDADGLELRMLAHYLARYDDGAYARTVCEGRKEDGTDVHSVNKAAAKLNERDGAKTFCYALLYGAGDFKLGLIAYDDFTDDQRDRFNAKYPKKREKSAALKRLGKTKRDNLMSNLPAFGKLVEAVKNAVKARGLLVGLDGRKLHIRGEHAALNTLLQSAGAVVMKRALVLLEETLVPLRANHTAAFTLNCHDEWAIDTSKEIADEVGRLAADSITRAGQSFNMRCPLKGNFAVGASWRNIH